jgi:hypothetical protein
MADNEATEAAKKKLAEERKVSDKVKADFAQRAKGKPTPTQEENDLAALGATFTEHEPDGSDPDPNVRHVEAEKPGGYQTRHQTAAPQAQHRSERERA